MVRIDVGKYIDELRGMEIEEKDLDLYSLKKELNDLNEYSEVFENFEKEAIVIDKNALLQINDLNSLIKMRALASEIRNKKQINDKLHSLHFNLNILKGSSDAKTVKNVINLFIYNNDTKIDKIINELNDFKTKINEIKKHNSRLSKGLENKLEIEGKYNKHIEHLDSIHRRQKNALLSTIKLFLELTRKQIKCQKSKISEHAQKSVTCERVGE